MFLKLPFLSYSLLNVVFPPHLFFTMTASRSSLDAVVRGFCKSDLADNWNSLFGQWRERSTQQALSEWEEVMGMMNLSTFTQSTCTTWTGCHTRSWRWLLVSGLQSPLALLSQFMLSSSSKRKLLRARSSCYRVSTTIMLSLEYSMSKMSTFEPIESEH